MEARGSVLAGAAWMTFLSALLFWLPVFGPLIAGIVGGKKAGGVGSGILAVFVPGVMGAALLFFFSAVLTGLPVVGWMMAAVGGFLYLANAGMLLVGAILGGLLA